MKKLSSLSIFFPCYNDENTIAGLVDDAYTIGKKITRSLEVIVIDDGSTDLSKKILKKSQKKHPNLKLVFHKKNRGYGGALRSGFSAATKKFIFYTDGDGQYSLKDLPKLVKSVKPKLDVINGKKIYREDRFIRKIVGELYYLWIKLLFQTPIREIDTDYRLIRKEKLKKITLSKNSGAICVELISKLKKAGANFTEVSVNHYDRKFGKSQFFTFSRIIQTLVDDIKLFFEFHSL